MPTLSAVVITLNEAARIGQCLAGLSFCDEIILVDSGSTDGTREIASQYTDKIYINEYQGDGPQKIFAVSKTKGRFILLMDADEVVPPALAAEIVDTIGNYDYSPNINPGSLPHSGKPVAWEFARRNHVGDIWVRHGGWYPDYQIRLWVKGKASNSDVRIHSGLIVDGPVGRLTQAFDHFTHDSVESYREKMILYAHMRAEDYYKWGKRTSALSPFLHQTWAFFKAYLLRAGFRDGLLGWRLAWLSSAYTGLKYRNLRAFQAGSRPS